MPDNNETAEMMALFDALLAGDYTRRARGNSPEIKKANELAARLDAIMLGDVSQKVQLTIDSFEDTISMGKLDQLANNLSERTLTMAAAAEEMDATVKTMAENSAQVNRDVSEARDSTNDGRRAVSEADERMQEITTQTNAAVGEVGRLAQVSSDIDQLISNIQKISDQTNLLALNATIEAARAGDAGRGFTVVAEEVKQLSQQTKNTAEEIIQKTSSIQAAIGSTTQAMENIVKYVEQGNESIRGADERMQTVGARMESISNEIAQVAQATSDQTEASNEIAENVSAASDMARTMHERSSDSLARIDQLVGSLWNSLTEYNQKKVSNMVIHLAKSDHMLWKKRLVDMILGRGTIELSEVTDHHNCRLGKWYDSEGQKEFGNNPVFDEIAAPHAEVHALARSAVEKFNCGDRDAAIADVEAIGPISDRIIELLDRLVR
ncbi:MAG TPA: methyl-accepting chemotaxis protein [Mariprofundaceae bacterium]|nr:methyl-accepting chemotaxis protein [Mariprofundaceae bacterium]